MRFLSTLNTWIKEFRLYTNRTDKLFIASAVAAVLLAALVLPGLQEEVYGPAHARATQEETLRQTVEFLELLGHHTETGVTAFNYHTRGEEGNALRYHFGVDETDRVLREHPAETLPLHYSRAIIHSGTDRDNYIRMVIFDREPLQNEAHFGNPALSVYQRRFQVDIDVNRLPVSMELSGQDRFHEGGLNAGLLRQALPGTPLLPEMQRLSVIGVRGDADDDDDNGDTGVDPVLPPDSLQILQLRRAEAEQLVRHVLSHTRWAETPLRVTDITISSQTSEYTMYRVVMQTDSVRLGRQLRIETDVDHLGYIHRINPTREILDAQTSALPASIHGESKMVILIMGGILAFVLFVIRFLRQQVDLKAGRSEAAAAFAAVLIVNLNRHFTQAVQDGYMTPGIWDMLGTILGSVMIAAGLALLMYVFASVGSSLSHEVWSERMHTLTLLRRGYLINQPVGATLLRSLSLGALITGVSVTLTALIPGTSLLVEYDIPSLSQQFLSGAALETADAVYGAQLVTNLVLLIFMALLYRKTRNKLVFYLVGGLLLLWTRTNPVDASGYITIVLHGGSGLVLLWAMHKYGALTALLTIASAWIWWSWLGLLSYNPFTDLVNLLSQSGVLLGLVLTGLAGIGSGISLTRLPDYIPNYILELANRERMARELEIARQVQQNFLPGENPTVPGFELIAACHPASEVGGDYYEFLSVSDNRLALAIGDVSGKGIQAAFFMTLIKGFTQSITESGEQPVAFLSRVNRLFHRNAPRGTFVSMIYGHLDLSGKSLTLARAGHNPAVWYQASTGEAQLVTSTGMALGLITDARFEDTLEAVTLQLAPGDLVFLYTDGYTEAMNRAGELYGEERLLQIIAASSAKTLTEIVDAIDADVRAFAGGVTQHDDMTIMGVRVL